MGAHWAAPGRGTPLAANGAARAASRWAKARVPRGRRASRPERSQLALLMLISCSRRTRFTPYSSHCRVVKRFPFSPLSSKPAAGPISTARAADQPAAAPAPCSAHAALLARTMNAFESCSNCMIRWGNEAAAVMIKPAWPSRCDQRSPVQAQSHRARAEPVHRFAINWQLA